MPTPFGVLFFVSCAAVQLFPLRPPSRVLSQITCISLWKVHDIWRRISERKQREELRDASGPVGFFFFLFVRLCVFFFFWWNRSCSRHPTSLNTFGEDWSSH